MRLSVLKLAILLASLLAFMSIAKADPPTASDTTPVVVHGATPLAPIAPAWQQGRTYKFGDLANYDGWAFKAGTGATHKRPNVAAEDGWEKLNSCDDKSKGAVQCELGNQAEVTDTKGPAERDYAKVQQEMSKGKPVNAASQ
jgi:hypothetical protein